MSVSIDWPAHKTGLLTNDITKDLPAAHPHPEEDLVLHDEDSDAKKGTDKAGVPSPVVEEGFEESDNGMDMSRPFVVWLGVHGETGC